MNNFRQPEADSSRPRRLLDKAFISVLLAALAAAAGSALLGLTPASAAAGGAAAAAQSDPSTPDLLWMNGGHAGGSGRAALSPDGQVLATADYSEVYLWRYSDGRLLRTLGAAYVDSIKCIRFTPDSQYVVAGGTWIPGSPNVSTLRMWRVSDGSPVRDFAVKWDVRSIALSADGTMLAAAVGGGDPTVTIFDVSTGDALLSLGAFSANAVAFSPDGLVAAAGAVQFGDPPMVRIWRASDGLQLFSLMGLNFITNAVAFSPDGRYLAAGDWGGNGTPGKVQVWLAPAFVPIQSFTPYDGPNGSLAFTPDSTSVAAVSNGGVNIWHLPDGLLTKVIPVTTGEATWNLIFPDDLTLVASGAWNRAGVWRVQDGARLRSIGNNREFVTSSAFSPDSAHLIVSNSVGPDETKGQGVGGVEMLRASDGAHERTFTIHNDIVNSVAYSPDGARVASASGSQPPDTRDTRIIISPASGVGTPLVLPGHSGGTLSVAFSPDSQLLASGGRDRAVRLWRVSDGSAVRAMGGHANWVNSVAFSPDGQTVASAGDTTVRLWRVSDGRLLRTIQPDGFPAGSVAFSPDGQTIASTTYNGVQLWRASDGQFLRSMNVTAGYINVGGVAFSADGSVVSVANGSYPPRVWFWRVSDGAVVRTYDRETGWVQPPSLAFSPDGTMLAIGRYDSHVEVARPPVADVTPTPSPTPTTTPTPGPSPTPAPALVNVALASNGATATASSTLDANRAPIAAINGDRRGEHWGTGPATGSGWHCATQNAYPDWLEIAFNGPQTISEVNVFSVQDNYAGPAEPTEAMTFTKYGVTNFSVEYWDAQASAWAPVGGGTVSGNNKVWRKLSFAPLVTTKLRVVVGAALADYSRLTEVEVWGRPAGPAPRVNVAAAANGATADASSTLDSNRTPLAAINGDRRGIHWSADPATGSGWHDATNNSYPDWLEITFNGPQTVSEVNVFSVQDNYAGPAEPTEAMTFTKYGLTDFEVEFWDGAAWQSVPGGMVTGNNKVWRRLSFAPLVTSKIRVVAMGGLAGYSRVAEVEAY